MSTPTLMTAEQFAQMRTGEREDYELVGGELIPLSSGTPRHSAIRGCIESALRTYLRRGRSGRAVSEIDCRLSESSVRRPDVSVFVGEKAGLIEPDLIPVPFAPDIAIEVLSPSESAIEVNRKALGYLAAGCQEVWVVDAENCEVFVQSQTSIRLFRGSECLESALLPGFSHPVVDLLAW